MGGRHQEVTLNMRKSILIKNAILVNEGQLNKADVLVCDGLICEIGKINSTVNCQVIEATGKYLIPGIIDAQVHFREPGLTHKGNMATESKAAVAGGVTSIIDMPNTVPNVLTPAILHNKYRIASESSWTNYGFFMGVNADNVDEIINMETSQFLAVSDDGLYFTKKGNLLVDNPDVLNKLFAGCKSIIAIHSEKEKIIEENENYYRSIYGEDIPIELHPLIRSEQACLEATQLAIDLARKHNARLHILHLSTEAEALLFQGNIPLAEKMITTEVSIHHLWFSEKDYERLGTHIKWNPAIKSERDRKGLFSALLDDRIDIITTDHAPHTLEEKEKPYFQSMSGAPMVQHSLCVMLEFYRNGHISLEKIVEKMCHNPAILYRINGRGFIREGYWADLTLVDLNSPWTVARENILYKCGWSPLEGTTFQGKATHTFVNGNLVFNDGYFTELIPGQRLAPS